VKFKDRFYSEFNLAMKKTKLRGTLSKIMASPDVYLRSKTPEEVFDTLQRLAEMRKYDRIKFLRDYNLFPSAEMFLMIDLKFGDSLTKEDTEGMAPIVKRRKSTLNDTAATQLHETAKASDLQRKTQDEFLSPDK
jgi:hypothetical protein